MGSHSSSVVRLRVLKFLIHSAQVSIYLCIYATICICMYITIQMSIDVFLVVMMENEAT